MHFLSSSSDSNDSEETCGLPQRSDPSSRSSSYLIQRAFSLHTISSSGPTCSSDNSTKICQNSDRSQSENHITSGAATRTQTSVETRCEYVCAFNLKSISYNTFRLKNFQSIGQWILSRFKKQLLILLLSLEFNSFKITECLGARTRGRTQPRARASKLVEAYLEAHTSCGVWSCALLVCGFAMCPSLTCPCRLCRNPRGLSNR